jgi:DNA-binding response OmpR family regulator
MTTTPIRVLIVDDEERFRETTAGILSRRHFEVTAVGDGLQAIEVVRNRDVDVVVLDVKMPRMDGHEALREIKKLKPDQAVIMLTGHGTPESALTGLREGVFDYLTKPCAIDLLAQKIRDAYGSRGKGELDRKAGEPKVRDIMVPLSSFSTVQQRQTVAEALEVLIRSFTQTMVTGMVRETVHRSILVLGGGEDIVGIVTFTDLLQNLEPSYMRTRDGRLPGEEPYSLDSLNFSGMFRILSRDLAKKTVGEVMSEAPPVIDGGANLMTAVSRLLGKGIRRLLVKEGEKTVGVIREQDLIFQMAAEAKHVLREPSAP